MSKLKNIPINEDVHSELKRMADERGMKLYGLAERILRSWVNDIINFANIITRSNTRQ